eukprot:11477361-Karenia_brevis.AAC.1
MLVLPCGSDGGKRPDTSPKIRRFRQRVVKGVLLLQEVATWSNGHEFEIDGWSIFHTSSNPSAVAVPHCLGQMVGGYETASMCC